MKLLALLCVPVLAVSAHAAVLDFDYTAQAITTVDAAGLGPLQPVGSGGWISQAYGDVAGLVDVSYRYIDAGGLPVSSLQTWATGYDELVYVAWFGSGSGGDRAQVELASVGGSVVTLNGFSLGSWEGPAPVRVETVRVYEIGQATPVYEFIGTIGAGNLSNTFTFGALQSASGFVVEWTSPWWTAIDNLDSSAAAVPEPGTWALLGLGLACVVGAARRRR